MFFDWVLHITCAAVATKWTSSYDQPYMKVIAASVQVHI